MKTRTVSTQTRNNFMIDTLLFIGAMISTLSGIYFLYFPIGGFQGGRNPSYGKTFLLPRDTWDDLHTWFGILMILVAIVHIVVHWNWIVSMTKRAFQELLGKGIRFNPRSRYNFFLNISVGLSFVLTSLSGIYLLFVVGGRQGIPDPKIIFTRTTWDLIHTWSAIALILFAVLHFAIHWGWVVKVTSKIFPKKQINFQEENTLHPVQN